MRIAEPYRWAMVFALVAVGCGGEAARDAQPPASPDAHPRVVMETSEGQLVLELNRAAAPQTVDNFLTHVRSRFYDGLVFHRVEAKLGVIQAGILTQEMAERRTTMWPLPNEANNGLHNVRGALAMARTADPHSATSQFFIDVKDNPQFDFRDSTAAGWGYAVFGHVAQGMDVVDAIARAPTHRFGSYRALPVKPIVIERAYIASDTTASP